MTALMTEAPVTVARLTIGTDLADEDGTSAIVTAIVQQADGTVAIFTNGNPPELMEGVPKGSHVLVWPDEHLLVNRLASRPSDHQQAVVAALIADMERKAAEEDRADERWAADQARYALPRTTSADVEPWLQEGPG